MGQKVNPISFRLGFNRDWDSKWFAEKDYAIWLLEDLKIRKMVKARLQHSGLSRIVVERTAKRIRVVVFSARPGIAIGRKGLEVERLTADLQQLAGKEVKLDIIEERKPDLSAVLVSESVANQLERRISYRRVVKKAIQAVMGAGAKGTRVQVGGRLGGSEIARLEWQKAGSVPLHTMKADIDFARATAFTTHGTIGVKVWIYKGELHEIPNLEAAALAQEKAQGADGEKPSRREPSFGDPGDPGRGGARRPRQGNSPDRKRFSAPRKRTAPPAAVGASTAVSAQAAPANVAPVVAVPVAPEAAK